MLPPARQIPFALEGAAIRKEMLILGQIGRELGGTGKVGDYDSLLGYMLYTL